MYGPVYVHGPWTIKSFIIIFKQLSSNSITADVDISIIYGVQEDGPALDTAKITIRNAVQEPLVSLIQYTEAVFGARDELNTNESLIASFEVVSAGVQEDTICKDRCLPNSDCFLLDDYPQCYCKVGFSGSADAEYEGECALDKNEIVVKMKNIFTKIPWNSNGV